MPNYPPFQRTKLQWFRHKSKYFKELAAEYQEAYEEAKEKLDAYDIIYESGLRDGVEFSYADIKEIYLRWKQGQEARDSQTPPVQESEPDNDTNSNDLNE